MDLVDPTNVEAEFNVVKTYIAKLNDDEKTKPSTIKLISEDSEALKTMPSAQVEAHSQSSPYSACI